MLANLVSLLIYAIPLAFSIMHMLFNAHAVNSMCMQSTFTEMVFLTK